ncbi:MAG: sterol desaturase family protein, partial [Candidatus Sericytochromatia bacterium]
MEINLISYAVPIFFTCIFLEALYSFLKNRSLYRINDSINSLSCGVTEQVIEVFLKAILYFQYSYIFNNFRVFELGDSWITWISCFVILDLVYYFFHRVAHEITIVWGSHNPHHQSEEYNLTTALRQGTFQNLFSNIFYCLLAVIGFKPVMLLVCLQLNLIYQFFIHTIAV